MSDTEAPGAVVSVVVPAGNETRVVVVPQHQDPELTAMAVVHSALQGLDIDAQRRVVDWAWARWHRSD